MKFLVLTLLLAAAFHVCKAQSTKFKERKLGIRAVRRGPSQRIDGFVDPNDVTASPLEYAPGCSVFRLDTDEKESIVNLHNHLRRRVAKGLETRGSGGSTQPMAANMLRMGYDVELEYFAHKFTAKCDPYYDQEIYAEGITDVSHAVVYETSTFYIPPYNLSSSFAKFFDDEVSKFNGDDATKSFFGTNSVTGEDVRAYALYVNHDTRSIGCSQATYFDQARQKYVRLATCYYGNGFAKGKPLYSNGQPCSDVHVRDCDDGLVIRESGIRLPGDWTQTTEASGSDTDSPEIPSLSVDSVPSATQLPDQSSLAGDSSFRRGKPPRH